MTDFQDRGESHRQRLGIDGTAGDAQDEDHPYIADVPHGDWCVVCGLAPSYRSTRHTSCHSPRGPIMPAESYTPDPALVELVARAAYEADSTQILGDEQLTWDEQPEQCHDWFRVIAHAVLAALATKGRLLPEPEETRTEWGIWWYGPIGDGILLTQDKFSSRRAAEQHAPTRIGDYGIARYEIRCREHRYYADRSSWSGPWLPAPTKTEITEEKA